MLRNGRYVHWSFVAAALVLGAAVMGVFDWEHANIRRAKRRVSSSAVRPFRVATTEYHFVNPLLGYELPQRGSVEPFRSIRGAVQSVIADALQARQAADASVYYRDLNSGSWFGVDEQKEYTPASLAKVPLMIAYFKMAETTPEILHERITFTHSIPGGPDQRFAPTERLIVGQMYTTEDLLRAMIVQSDNEAAFLLQRAADPVALAAVYADLNIAPPEFENPNATISPVTFSRFFRFLYNGTYLSKEYSERALTLLSESTFDRGLVASTPSGVPVAHKFGERLIEDGPPEVARAQLHDCGIVYHPTNPYLMCVMTRGWTYDALEETIQRIASVTYAAVPR